MNLKKERYKRRKKDEKKPMLFTALNYKLMGMGVLLVIVGFTAMYMDNEVHGFISLYVSPIMILGGYIMVIAAILKKDGNNPAEPKPST